MELKKFNETTEQFINQRINDVSYEESAELTQASDKLKKCADSLATNFTEEQIKLWHEYELAFSLLEGETMDFFYRAGFADAINFILKMNGTDKNK